jgi:ATP-dependent Lon protease
MPTASSVAKSNAAATAAAAAAAAASAAAVAAASEQATREEAEKQATARSDEITSLLIHMTDPAQNATFTDKYFKDIPLDISRCIQVFTMNDPSALSPILRDRMIMIEVAPYAEKDKLHIAASHLVPCLLRQFHMAPGDVTFPEETIKAIIKTMDDEAGVRTLRRGIECILSSVNLGTSCPRAHSASTRTHFL